MKQTTPLSRRRLMRLAAGTLPLLAAPAILRAQASDPLRQSPEPARRWW